MNTGQILNWVVAYKFQKDGDDVFASLSFSDGYMGMPEPRMMHQSLIVNSNGKPHLLVCGGKTGLNTHALKFSS